MTETIKEPWGLSVLGAGSVRAEPQLVRVKLGVEVLEPAPGQAFHEAGSAVTRLREVLRRHGIPDSSVSGSRLRLSSEYGHANGARKFLGYLCQAQYVVETEALDDLQQLIVEAVGAGARSIDGVEFDVHDKPALRDEARRRAVAAARRKAEVYTEAAGVPWGRWCTSRTWTPSRTSSASTAGTAAVAALPRATSRRGWWRCPRAWCWASHWAAEVTAAR